MIAFGAYRLNIEQHLVHPAHCSTDSALIYEQEVNVLLQKNNALPNNTHTTQYVLKNVSQLPGLA